MRKVPKSRIDDSGVQILLENIPRPRKVFWAMWKKPMTRYILITSFLTKLSFMALNMYWPLMGARAGLLEEDSGLLASGMLTATLIGSLMFNKGIVFSSSIKGIGVIGLVLGIPLLFTGILSPVVFVGALLLHEVARGAYYPVFKTFLNTYTQHETRSTANSIVNAARMYGGLIGLLLSGLLALKGGPNSLALTWVLSGVVLTVIGGYALLIRNNAK